MNTLLITGATGFLGGAVLESILNKKNAPNLLLLVRADNSVAAVERVKENLRKFNISEERLTALTPGNILLGDLANPQPFLDDPRLNQVTHVLNCAAVASFGNNPLIWKVRCSLPGGWLRSAALSAFCTSAPRCPARQIPILW